MKLSEKKIKGIILGHAVADALGVPVEFESRETLKNKPVRNMLGYGTYPFPAGCWSDDTSMTLCALESLSRGKYDLDDVMNNFGRWYYKDEFTPTGELFDVGNTCSFAIDNYFAKKTDTAHCGLTGDCSNGNGSLMRIIPFVLYSVAKYGAEDYDKLNEIVAEGSALTHAHPRSILACRIYAAVLTHLIDGADKWSALESSAQACKSLLGEGNGEYHRFVRINTYFFKNATVDEIKSTGYVVDTLEAALWCLMTTDSYRDCVLQAVNLGDDTDTVAAVAGGLAGALYGMDAIPEEWLNTLKRREYIENLCDTFAESRT